jgi:branched-chain amino acid transport system permease protein
MGGEWAATGTLAVIYAIVAVATQLGMISGGFSLAPIGWMGVGAYASGLASTKWEAGPLTGLAVGLVVAAIGGPLVMSPVRRISGLYYALVSLAFVLVVQSVLGNLEYTGGPIGIYGVPLTTTFGVSVAAFVPVALIATWLSRGDRGRRMRSAGQDAMVAQTFGVNVYGLQLLIGAISAGMGVLAGVLYAGFVGYVDPTQFGFALVIQILVMVVIGGRGSWLGAVMGAFLITALPVVLRPLAEWRDVVDGALLILVMVFAPGGLYAIATTGIHWLRRSGKKPGEPDEGAEEHPVSDAYLPVQSASGGLP